MVYILGQLKVENFGKWKSTFDGVSAQRKEAGSKEALVFSNSNDQNEVVILFKWDNMENAEKYFESDFLKKRLKEAGSQITSITYLDEVEKTI